MDVNFHLSQAFIAKLHLITDRVPWGVSLTRTLMEHNALVHIHFLISYSISYVLDLQEIINNAETYLKEAAYHVTAANSQASRDAYLFFYSRLKFAEFRMLEIACAYHISNRSQSFIVSLTHSLKGMHELQPEDQFELLKKAIINLVEVVRARSLTDNFDLHYIANMHMVLSLTNALYTHALTLAH